MQKYTIRDFDREFPNDDARAMPRREQTIPANGAVLKWARQQRGYSPSEAARLLGVSIPALTQIEEGTTGPTAPVFRKMLSVYQQVESVLLFPEPPDSDPLPQDFRAVGGNQSMPSPETLYAIRDVRRIQHYVTDILEDEPELLTHASISVGSLSDDPERLASEERQRFGVTLKMQRAWRMGDDSFKRWRARAQELGVLVFLKKMPRADCRGVALWDSGLVPAIVVNTEDKPNGAIYTLFHEYAHLVLRGSGACALNTRSDRQAVENWCNKFAAAFLIPREELRESVARRFPALGPDNWTTKDIRLLSTEYKVSRVAIARRLEELGFSHYYTTHADELYLFDQERTRESEAAGGPLPEVIRLSEVGYGTATVIIEAMNSQIIDTFEAADILGLKVDQLGKFEERAAVQRRRDTFVA